MKLTSNQNQRKIIFRNLKELDPNLNDPRHFIYLFDFTFSIKTEDNFQI